MFFSNNKISLPRVLRYVFFIALTFWVLVSIPVFYTYVRSSSQEVVNKGGTFVEGIFDTTSYLPYLSNDPKSLFYQGLLFRSCLSYEIHNQQKMVYDNDLCKVDTKDHKTYYVSVIPENTWSDGVPISLEDIYFTYKTILVDNAFDLKSLKENANITISKENNKIKVEFPEAKRDNNVFFTNYILPQHILMEPNIDMYQQSFALEPVYNNCAKIYSQSTDQYSLVFDLSQCKDTNIGFYQIKNLQKLENLEKTIKEGKKSIVDAYEHDTILSGYTKEILHTDKYILLFLNTQSPRLLVRTRRALGGLINYEISKAKDMQYFDTYNGALFSKHLSTGQDIKSFITTAISDQDTNVKSIKDSDIQQLPKKIAIKGTNQAYAYHTTTDQEQTLQFTVDQKYDKVAVQFNQETLYYPKSYSKTKKTFKYLIGTAYENINKGLNSYTVYGFYKQNRKEKKVKLASIKVYLIDEKIDKKSDKKNNENNQEQNTTEKKEIPQQQLKILYYNKPINQYIVSIIKKIFAKHDISEFFSFEEFDDESKFHGAISNGEYDIVIGSVNSSLKKSFYSFLNTDKAILNPSKYVNQKLSSLLLQYNEHTNPTTLKEINATYSNNVPFVVVGKEQKTLAINPDIKNKVIGDTSFHEYDRRKKIYTNLVLTKNIYIDSKGLFSIKNFYLYLTQ